MHTHRQGSRSAGCSNCSAATRRASAAPGWSGERAHRAFVGWESSTASRQAFIFQVARSQQWKFQFCGVKNKQGNCTGKNKTKQKTCELFHEFCFFVGDFFVVLFVLVFWGFVFWVFGCFGFFSSYLPLKL